MHVIQKCMFVAVFHFLNIIVKLFYTIKYGMPDIRPLSVIKIVKFFHA